MAGFVQYREASRRRRCRHGVLSFLLCVALGFHCRSTDTTPELEAPVFVLAFQGISLDNLVDAGGQVDGGRFPNLAALARQSTFLTAALAPSDEPDVSFEALWSGAHAPDAAANPGLCQALAGHDILWNDSLCGPDAERARARIALLEGDEDRAARFRRFVASIESDRAGHYVFRSSLPDAPWRYLADGEQYRAPLHEVPGSFGDFWGWRESLVSQGRLRHEQQLRFLDSLIGEFLHRLDELELRQRASIILLATRGVSFRRAEKMHRLSEDNVEDILRVPVLVHRAGQNEGDVVGTPLSLAGLVSGLAEGLAANPSTPLPSSSGLHHAAFPARAGEGSLCLPRPEPRPGASLPAPAAAGAGGVPSRTDPAASLPTTLRSDAGIHVTGDLASRIRREEVPVLLSGRLTGVAGVAPVLSLEINGHLADRVDTYGPAGGDFWFSFWRTDDWLLEDVNDIAFLLESGFGTPARLPVIPATAASGDLGTRHELVEYRSRPKAGPCAVEGYAEAVERIGDEISLRGWAKTNQSEEPPWIEIHRDRRRLYSWHPAGTWASMRRFEVRIPANLAPGRNFEGLRMALASPRCGRTWLYPLHDAFDYALTDVEAPWISRRGSRRVLHLDGRREVPLVARKPVGWIEHVDEQKNGWFVRGWAGDPERGETPVAIYALLDDRVVALAHLGGLRPDVAEALGQPGLERSGFDILLPLPHAGYRLLVVTQAGWAAEITDARVPLP